MILNLHKMHHTPYKVVSCFDVLKDGFWLVRLSVNKGVFMDDSR